MDWALLMCMDKSMPKRGTQQVFINFSDAPLLTLFYAHGFRDSCFTCDSSSNIEFPLFFSTTYGNLPILEFSSKCVKVMLP
jgi:hypothetical protein